jgi:hypothetical protein
LFDNLFVKSKKKYWNPAKIAKEIIQNSYLRICWIVEYVLLRCWLIVICILPRISSHTSLFVFHFGINYPFGI